MCHIHPCLKDDEYIITTMNDLCDYIRENYMRRKIQYFEDNETIHSYYVPHERNPCGCGSNLYHLQYDGISIYGVCNACKEDIYILNEDVIQKHLNKGIWR